MGVTTAEVHPVQRMNWYALTVKAQHEKAVADQLRAKALESYLPLYRARRRWSDRTKTIEMPLFSRYVFCRFNFEARLKVLQVSSIVSIVGFGGKPCPIPDHEIQTIQAVVGSGLPVSPWPFLRVGQRVRVTEGALEGLEGILARKKSGYRVVVNMELLNRAVAVEIEQDLVRVVAGAPTAPLSEPYLSR